MNIIQMSISGTVIIIVIAVMRAFTINLLPKKTFIALWGIVLLRLLLPFSIPSPFSAYSFVNRVSLQADSPAMHTPASEP